MDKAISAVVTVLVAIVSVAIIAVLVSGQAQTASVITAGGNAFTGILKAAVSPVSGGGFLTSTGVPSLPSIGGY